MNPTEEQLADIKVRREAFIAEYGDLRAKHQMDFASFPMWIPNEQGAFETRINTDVVDLKYRSVPSSVIVDK